MVDRDMEKFKVLKPEVPRNRESEENKMTISSER